MDFFSCSSKNKTQKHDFTWQIRLNVTGSMTMGLHWMDKCQSHRVFVHVNGCVCVLVINVTKVSFIHMEKL